MPPGEFPFPSANGSAAHPLFYEELPEEFVVTRTIFDDNGHEKGLQAGGQGRLVINVKYNGVTAAQAAIFDAHIADAFYSPDQGSAYGFNLRLHIPGEVWTSTNGTLKANVFYAPNGIKKSHSRVWNYSYEFSFEWRP